MSFECPFLFSPKEECFSCTSWKYDEIYIISSTFNWFKIIAIVLRSREEFIHSQIFPRKQMVDQAKERK
jgi:hypothetical protein